jgi:hypothetical protein
MSTLVIESLGGTHYGFLLCAGESEDEDCIFHILPFSVETFDDPQFHFLEKFGFRLAGEHKWKRNGKKIFLDLSTGEKAHIDLISERLTFSPGAIYSIKEIGTEPDGAPSQANS